MENMNQFHAESIRKLTVEQWRTLNAEDVDIPVYIQLHGCSMSPLVRRLRDVVCIRAFKRKPLPGDIVLFQRNDGQYVVHRVWKIREDQCLTFGDNCTHPDGWRPMDEILGLVTHVKRDDRTISVDNRISRKLGLIWLYLQPVRRILMRVLRKIKRILRGRKS